MSLRSVYSRVLEHQTERGLHLLTSVACHSPYLGLIGTGNLHLDLIGFKSIYVIELTLIALRSVLVPLLYLLDDVVALLPPLDHHIELAIVCTVLHLGEASHVFILIVIVLRALLSLIVHEKVLLQSFRVAGFFFFLWYLLVFTLPRWLLLVIVVL
jgi:hypothetical protein